MIQKQNRVIEVSRKSRPTANASLFMIIVLIVAMTKFVSAQTYVPSSSGYYYKGSQNQAFQTSGSQTDHRGVMNGGITVGPVGVQGYNNGNTYTYQTQQTKYRNVPQFYYSNGNSCSAKTYNDYQLPKGGAVYDQSGRAYQNPPIIPSNQSQPRRIIYRR